MSAAIPRPAATIVVLRERDGGPFEVLLVKRNDKVVFMAGAYVFPGGRVDENDLVKAQTRRIHPDTRSRFDDLSEHEEQPYRLAAVRELEEEAGVLVRPDDLVPLAHWVTPEVEPRRYDTRFYLVVMPAGQDARHDASELTALVWVSPAAAIERCRNGGIMLPPPTWTTLKQLSRFRSIDDVFAWAESKPIVRIQPNLVREERRAFLTLPGDPLHASIPGWEVPEDTRFELEEGKGWRPINPD